MLTVRQAEQELADYLVEHPELYQMQLQIDNGLAKYNNPIDKCKFLARMMQHYCVDLSVECKMLNHDLEKVVQKLT